MKVKDLIPYVIDKVYIYTFANDVTTFLVKEGQIFNIPRSVSEMEVKYISVSALGYLNICVREID